MHSQDVGVRPTVTPYTLITCGDSIPPPPPQTYPRIWLVHFCHALSKSSYNNSCNWVLRFKSFQVTFILVFTLICDTLAPMSSVLNGIVANLVNLCFNVREPAAACTELSSRPRSEETKRNESTANIYSLLNVALKRLSQDIWLYLPPWPTFFTVCCCTLVLDPIFMSGLRAHIKYSHVHLATTTDPDKD